MIKKDLENVIRTRENNKDAALLREIVSSPDFRFVNAAPVSVEPKKEAEQMKIHYDSVLNAGFDNWGFESTLEKLGTSKRENIQFIGFNGAGYSAKLYFEEIPEKVIGVVVTRRPSASPAIDQAVIASRCHNNRSRHRAFTPGCTLFSG